MLENILPLSFPSVGSHPITICLYVVLLGAKSFLCLASVSVICRYNLVDSITRCLDTLVKDCGIMKKTELV